MSRDMIARAIDKAMSRVRAAFRAVLTTIDTSTPIQLVQADGLAGEQLQDNELMQHYGFSSAPLPGTQMIVLPVGGKTAHGIVVATEHVQYRMKGLKNGEVAIYDDQGQSVHLTRGGIVVKGAGLPLLITDTSGITLDAENTHVTGTLTVDGDVSTDGMVSAVGNITSDGEIIDSTGRSMSGMRTTFNGHKHGTGPLPDRAM